MKKVLLLIMVLSPALAFAGPSYTQPTPKSLAADPSTCSTTGAWYLKFYYNTTSNTWKYCSATNTWATLAGFDGSGNMTLTGTLTVGGLVVGAGTPNEGGTGTTLNKLAKYTGTNTLTLATTADTAIPVFIVTSGAGKTGNAFVATSGTANCVFDGATTANHFVVASVTSNGECHDAGATAPTSGWVIGQVLSTNGGGGTYSVSLNQGYNAGGGGDMIKNAANVMGASGTINLTSASPTAGFIVPIAGGAAPTANGVISYDSTANRYVAGGTEGGSATTGTYTLARGFPSCIGLGPGNALDATNGVGPQYATDVVCTFPANYWTVGKTISVDIGWNIITPATAVSTKLIVSFEKTGPVRVALWDSGVGSSYGINLTHSAGLHLIMTCRSTGATGTINVIATQGNNVSAGLAGLGTSVITFDTTAAQNLEYAVTFGGTTAGNQTVLENLTVLTLN